MRLFHTVYEIVFFKREFILVHRSVETVEKKTIVSLYGELGTFFFELLVWIVNWEGLIDKAKRKIFRSACGLLKTMFVRKWRPMLL